MNVAKNRGRSVSGEGTACRNPRIQKNMVVSRSSKDGCVAAAQ